MAKWTMGEYYNQYRDIRQRLYNPRNPSFKYCQGLDFDFDNYQEFHNYVINSLGPRPSTDYQMTRRDLAQGYVRGNLVWRPRKWIGRRQRTCIMVQYRSRWHCLSELSERLGLDYCRLTREYKRTKDVKASIRYARKI